MLHYKNDQKDQDSRDPSWTQSGGGTRDAAYRVLERFCHDMEMFSVVAEVFLQDYPQRLAQVQQACRQQDAEQLHQAAHSLKGAVGNFVDGHAFATAARLEALAIDKDLSQSAALCDQLAEQLHELEAAIRSAMDSNQS